MRTVIGDEMPEEPGVVLQVDSQEGAAYTVAYAVHGPSASVVGPFVALLAVVCSVGSMATSTAIPILADRADVHKSCKSLESIANALNDYCQAADSLVLTQKKLAKALREIHNLKGVSDLIGTVKPHSLHYTTLK